MCRLGGFHTLAMFFLCFCVCEAKRLGTLRSNHATETSLKTEFAFFQSFIKNIAIIPPEVEFQATLPQF